MFPAFVLDGFQCDLFRLEYDTYLKYGKYRGGVDRYTHWMKRDDLLAALRHFGLTEIEIPFEQTVASVRSEPHADRPAIVRARGDGRQG